MIPAIQQKSPLRAFYSGASDSVLTPETSKLVLLLAASVAEGSRGVGGI
jgi:hypothetical protein